MFRWLVFVFYFIAAASSLSAQEEANPNLHRMGLRAYGEGRYSQAESLLRSALVAAGDNERTKAAIYADLGILFLEVERTQEAEQAYTNALALYRRQDDKRGIALVLRHLGALYSLERRHEEAITIGKEALQTAQSERSLNVLLSPILNSLGVAYFRDSQAGKAEKYFKQALEAAAVAELNPVETATILNNLGAIAYQQKKVARAEELLKESLRRTSLELGPDHPMLTHTFTALGVVYTDSGRFADAESMYERCLAILELSGIVNDPRIARTLKSLSDMYLKAGKKEKAEDVLNRASLIARQKLNHPDMPSVLDAHARVLTLLGRQYEANLVREEARRARLTLENTVRAYIAR